jgi:hypothetical protein
MTPDKQIEQLDNRVTRLEDRTETEITAIHAKLDSLVTLLNSHMVSAVKRECPSPGACVGLSENLKTHISYLTATTARVERLELRMMDLEKWQGRMLGGVAVLMVLLTLFGENIRHILRIP